MSRPEKNLLSVLVVIVLIGVSGDGYARNKGENKDEESAKVERNCISSDDDAKDRGLKKPRRDKGAGPSVKGAVPKVATDGPSEECDEGKRLGKGDNGKKGKGSVKSHAAKKAGKAAVTGIAVKKAKDAIKD